VTHKEAASILVQDSLFAFDTNVTTLARSVNAQLSTISKSRIYSDLAK
jgi:hypothetical protein